ncbi:MAG: class I SAM-dependent methyltransferase [bacterium]|nr:class I SAM-dependent methyltransferase [bacterium]
MDDRLQREKEFHDEAFEQNSRADLDKFYKVCRAAYGDYAEWLRVSCAGKRVLEYGCGTGSQAFTLAAAGAEVWAIDISDVAIRKAAETARKKGLEQRTHFEVMDAEQLRFTDGSFDVICGTGILHHLDLDRAFAEIARTLDAHGTAMFLEPTGHNPIVNFYRNRTPQLRTPDEHPLLMRDLQNIERYFGEVEPRFYNNLSLAAFLFHRTPVFSTVLGLLDATDRAMFKLVPVTRRFGWHVLLKLRAPGRGVSNSAPA